MKEVGLVYEEAQNTSSSKKLFYMHVESVVGGP